MKCFVVELFAYLLKLKKSLLDIYIKKNVYIQGDL
jgi:hypothetical protein